MEPLLSIVIPTRNRSQYCIAVLENILSYDYPRLELCIQDNSDDRKIEEYISTRIYDSRLIYKYIPEQLASVINIGESLGLATGKYVILLGDDDTILPTIFSAVEYMEINNIDSLTPIPLVNYYWPGAHPLNSDGYLIVPSQVYAFNEIKDVNRKYELLFEQGIVRHLQFYLPRVYHGIVRREALDEIKRKTGYYAGGLSPDIYLSIGISTFIKKHYTTEFSISISGACNKSLMSDGINKGHRGELKDAPHFNLRGQYHWDKRIPDYYSVSTIWAESALKAVEEMQVPKLGEIFNFNYLAAYSLLYNRSIFNIAFKHTFNKWKNMERFAKILRIGGVSIGIYISYLVTQIKKRVNDVKPAIEINKDIPDISKAVKAVIAIQDESNG